MSVKKTILSVVGTRPNFMKVGPLEDILKTRSDIQHVIVHTGQHYDSNMSDDFFRDFSLRAPDIHLAVSGGSLGDQTGRIMIAFEKALLEVKPDLVVVVGDVNSTFATAWVAVQNHIPVAHVESGLRSFDRTMPEEINRICTDAIADLLLTTHAEGDEQLIKEGIESKKIHRVGNIMTDYLLRFRQQAQEMQTWKQFNLTQGRYGLLTMHRPSNVDQKEQLSQMIETLITISKELPLVFPIHPRTKHQMSSAPAMNRLESCKSITLIEPVSYLKFLSLMVGSKLVLTDSGGIQVETSYLNIPCLTLRRNTEWGICEKSGTNYLVGTDAKEIIKTFQSVMTGQSKKSTVIPLWDGKTAGRTVKVLSDYLDSKN